jgi:hypothetical protein
MKNPLYPIILEEMGRILRISRRDLEYDIRGITDYWEANLEKAQINNRDTAIFVLTSLVTCYLRGKGFYISNSRRLNENHGILITLVTLATLYAWKQPERYYPRIHELVPLYNEGESELPSNHVLRQAEKILREKQQQ